MRALSLFSSPASTSPSRHDLLLPIFWMWGLRQPHRCQAYESLHGNSWNLPNLVPLRASPGHWQCWCWIHAYNSLPDACRRALIARILSTQFSVMSTVGSSANHHLAKAIFSPFSMRTSQIPTASLLDQNKPANEKNKKSFVSIRGKASV